MLNGLMMDNFQLSLTVLIERAERLIEPLRLCPAVVTGRCVAPPSVSVSSAPGDWQLGSVIWV